MISHPPAIKGKKGSVAVLDIGTHKLACFIAEEGGDGMLHITGIGHQLAKGFRAGVITDAHEAETSISCTVNAAEEMAGETIENIVVSLSGVHLQSHLVDVELGVSGEEVTQRDIAEILREGCGMVHDSERSIIHCFATKYQLDDQRGIKDPIHMFGKTLGADLHVISADDIRLKNLSGCIGRCHLNVSDFIVSSHAAGLGCLEADEMELGVTLIDMGAGQTSVAVFSGGRNIYSTVVPVGGQHVTSDIAKGLSTSLASAERIKSLHGSAIAAPQDNQAMINIPQLGEDSEQEENNMMPRSVLIGIIRPRLEEILELVRDRMEASGIVPQAGRNAVLTGGASQLIGLRDLAGMMLNKQVRLGKPHLVPGLADSVSGPGFSSAVGMIRYIQNRPMEDGLLTSKYNSKGGFGVKARINGLLNWMKENF